MILQSVAEGKDDKESIDRILNTTPGLENFQPDEIASLCQRSDRTVDEIRRDVIIKELEGNLMPNEDKKRRHRKLHGTLPFVEMGKTMYSKVS